MLLFWGVVCVGGVLMGYRIPLRRGSLCIKYYIFDDVYLLYVRYHEGGQSQTQPHLPTANPMRGRKVKSNAKQN